MISPTARNLGGCAVLRRKVLCLVGWLIDCAMIWRIRLFVSFVAVGVIVLVVVVHLLGHSCPLTVIEVRKCKALRDRRGGQKKTIPFFPSFTM